jgi:hypothetical protein
MSAQIQSIGRLPETSLRLDTRVAQSTSRLVQRRFKLTRAAHAALLIPCQRDISAERGQKRGVLAY